ncbi:cytochrome P450 [Paractinoplanes ferrugineus]|uniref:Cytochrome P450 n=1 Tax=Paractinoplanes ferrugineus TaxID=113564 RepID=A0A919MBI9_9ACTN|nr:cytochrome P450 [Actinoplanes ferrugineus]GIE13711.1 cytochrome P450 [Actinoplanes ferrugineus]
MSTDQVHLRFPFVAPGSLELPPEFAALRTDEPVAPVTLPTGDRAWLLTRYADVRAALADARLSRAAAEAPDAPRMGNTTPGGKTILGMDPPDHTRLRRLVMQAFTARRVVGLRKHIQQKADELVNLVLVAPRPVDLMSCYALSLPIKVIFELLGVPYEDRDRLHAWSEIIFALGDRSREEVGEARGRIESYLADLIAQRRATPSDDLLGLLVHARDEGNKLSEEELLNFALILLTVGHQSTANSLGTALFLLLRHPEQLDRLRADPKLIGPAVEELLRYNPFVFTGTQLRVALEDLEIAGVTIRRGEAVICALGSANHDATVFDDADRLDIGRLDNPHLAFGFGVHHCLGAQLARMEMQIAIETLVRRVPATMHLAVPEQWLTWKTGLTARALANLPVDW